MTKIPQRKSAEFKFKLAIEAIKGEKPMTQIASENNLDPKQIQRWRDQLLDQGKDLFLHKNAKKETEPNSEKLLHIIDQMRLELEFVKKKLKKNS